MVFNPIFQIKNKNNKYKQLMQIIKYIKNFVLPPDFQYTDKQMKRRYYKMLPKIWRKKGIDILLTHSPARGFHDGQDMPHMGFECFNTIIQKYEPKLFIHGHVHMNYGRDFRREDMYGNTKVINAFERYIIEI